MGPTGSGKSDLALELATVFDGEVVNCDSIQVYRYLDIGAAKTPPEERRGIPHHMLDIADPDEWITAGEYAQRARAVLTDISGRGKLPIVAGGTGFYMRALLDGLFPGPTRDPVLRRRLAGREKRRPGSLHHILGRFDPAAASSIHRNDTNKLIRALEVCLVTRRPLSTLHREGRDALRGFRTLKLALDPPRNELYLRLDERSRRMFEGNLLEEVRVILSRGFSPDAKPLGSLGYRQALQAVRGEITLEEAIASTRQETRRYAKRQWTWFRRDPGVVWLAGFGSDPAVQRPAIEHVRRHIQTG
jgi:tRNA dimethylallyltransferase